MQEQIYEIVVIGSGWFRIKKLVVDGERTAI
jgi:hypothetical protein